MLRITAFSLAPIALGAIVGCSPPPDAPEDLGELSQYMFQHFEGDGAELIAGAPALESYLLGLDLESKVNDRAVTLPILSDAHVEGLPRPDEVLLSDLVPVGVSAVSQHPMPDHRALAIETNFVCIDSDNAKFAARKMLSDTECFVDGSCEWLRTTNEIRRETPLIDFWYDLKKDYRLVELDDGRPMMISRAWMEDIALSDNGKNSWDQNYLIDVFIEHPDAPETTLRFYGMWASARVGGLSDNLLATTMTSSIGEGLENAENFMQGVLCDNDRNAEFERP